MWPPSLARTAGGGKSNSVAKTQGRACVNAIQNVWQDRHDQPQTGCGARTRATVGVVWAPKRLVSEQHLHGHIRHFTLPATESTPVLPAPSRAQTTAGAGVSVSPGDRCFSRTPSTNLNGQGIVSCWFVCWLLGWLVE